MSISFSYRKEGLHGNRVIYRPKIPVTFRKYKKEVSLIAIIDSGSDATILSKEVAEQLGLAIGGKKGTLEGIGGVVETVEFPVNLVISKKRVKEHIPQMPVKVLLSDSPVEDAILGRIPFFSNFDITFKENARKIVLNKSVHGRGRSPIEIAA
ncbi:hypothetical protein A3K63_03080 [Candidatus Micrarchaeota archaeon RBG_16_49_10]|nr:MAG: hypothetical protein A3K63_03080 [Candidatus Micrarchaeota archaeon RBG_16_49_10]